MAFDQTTRNRLNRFVTDARKLLANEFTRQLQAIYGMNPVTGDVADIKTLMGLTPSQQKSAQLLRDTFDHYLVNGEKGKNKERKLAALDRIVREQAFTVLNRIAALRMSEARDFLIESIASGYESKGFQLFQRIAGTSLGETGEAYRHYLFSIFDEFSLDLSVLFDRFSAQGRLFPSTPVLIELLTLVNDDEVAPLWAEDETIGWIYQYFNSQEERKKMRDASQAPRNSRELAVRNQFFTPRYIVEFLTDNTLGRLWYEMTQGKTQLVEECEYFVRRPNEIFLMQGKEAPELEITEGLSQDELLKQTVYIEHRELKDPRDIKMLDPACGSMHFGLYCFDLFERIYEEAWDIEISQGSDSFLRESNNKPLTGTYSDKAEFLKHIPRLIIENNIHGVDIDPRAAQVAGLSLWQRAHNSWQQAGIKPQHRHQILKSNIVCAEPMPGEKELLQEFTSQLKPTVLGQLVEVIFDKMQLAGEAGTLLKIEKEIEEGIAGAKAIWHRQNQALSQFPDLTKVAKQRGDIDFDVSDIDDEGFWHQAEQKILDALAQYASSASSNMTEQKRLFASDAAKGFGFIDLCKKRFDVVLMNPPFGEGAKDCKSLFNKDYSFWSKNILCCFIGRAKEMCVERGYYAAIFDRTVIQKSSYEAFRTEIVIDDVAIVADTGWEVLDANVETTSFVFRNNNTSVLSATFFDLRDAEKEVKDQELLNSIRQSKCYTTQNVIFRSFPNAIIGYDFDDYSKAAFLSYDNLKEQNLQARKGHDYVSFQHFRLFWERNIAIPLEQSEFVRVYNGGKYTSFLSPLRDIVVYGKEADIVREHKSVYIRNEKFHFKPGVGFGKRGDILDAHFLPSGFSFTSEGLAITDIGISEAFILLSYLNSSVGQYLLNSFSGQHKQVGYVNLLPMPNLEANVVHLIINNAKSILNEKLTWLSVDETTPFYSPSSAFELFSKDINELNAKCNKSIETFKFLLANNDSYFEQCFSTGTEIPLSLKKIVTQRPLDLPLFEDLSNAFKNESLEKFVGNYRLSLVLGIIWGRWTANSIQKKYDLNFEELNELVSKPVSTPLNGRDVFCLDFDTLKLNDSNFKNIFKVFWPNENATDQSSMATMLSRKLKLNDFFDFHLIQYTKSRREAPIYWPIETLGNTFCIWIYYHSLDDQTLLKCLNNYVLPKLELVEAEIKTLLGLTTRTKIEDTSFEKQLLLKAQLNELKDRLLELSKFWQPNQNDGVQITAAPLWRLFQHKIWQKKLKETWHKLEDGDYDWAHLAFSTWPERVLKKCYADRSLAITHDVVNDLWHEVEVIKARKKEPVWEWQPKPLSDSEFRSYIKEKITTDDRLKLYRSNNANANGGAL